MYKPILKTRFIGKNLNYLTSCHSTNDIAAHKVRSGIAVNGEIVIAGLQTGGRGQRGNTWDAESGQNFTLSIILKPQHLSVANQFQLSKCTALGIRSYVASKTEKKVTVKWPNDVLIGEKKVAGVLIENRLRGSRIEASVVGIGLNMNQNVFNSERITSLFLEEEKQLDLGKELDELASFLEYYYELLEKGDYDRIDELYLRSLFGFREIRSFTDGTGRVFEGKVEGVTADGRLRLQVDLEEKQFDVKEITWIW